MNVMTADELLRLPDDGYRYELVRGELRKSPYATAREGALTAHIITHLYPHARGLGTLVGAGFILARHPDTVRAPDIAFVRKERDVNTDDYFPGPPDLAIEVTSPWALTARSSRKQASISAPARRAVVIVDPRTAEVHVHRVSSVTKIAETLAVEDVVPG